METTTMTLSDTHVLPLGAVPTWAGTGCTVRDTAGMRGARPRPAQGHGTAVPVTLAPVPSAHGTGVSGAVTRASLFLLLDDDVQGLPPRGAPV